MKILLITGSNPIGVPYLKYYIDILKKENIKYDILCWDRKGNMDTNKNSNSNYIIYTKPTSDLYSPIRKFIEIYKFYRFSMEYLRKNNYDKIIIYTISTALFFQRFLELNYKNKYIFDIRDYSPLMKVSITRSIVNKLIKHSAFTCISSIGFKEWLPKYDFVISHNFDSNLLKKHQNTSDLSNKNVNKLNILTIGALRDPDSNSFILKHLANDSRYNMEFAGDGNALEYLKTFAEDRSINNVIFSGRYNKQSENLIVQNADLINIYLPNNKLSNFLMSNRFYLSVFHRKPMIVNENSLQAYYVRKYNLGVIISECDNVADKIFDYYKTMDETLYYKGCTEFLEIVKNDYNIFSNQINSFFLK